MNIDEELGFVISDEIHYINDRDRGHVGKSCMNQLTHSHWTISHYCISRKTCEWSQHPKKQTVEKFTCVLTKLNVPIEHCAFITIPESNYKSLKTNLPLKTVKLVVEIQDNPFEEENYNKLKNTLKYIYDHKIQIKDSFVFNKVIEYLKANNLLPGLVFVFSRKQCRVWSK